MRRIPFNPRFVNGAGDDLVPGKIHTIRRNYEYWKKFEGQDVALYIWEGKPYRSRQRVFCAKRLVSVQKCQRWWSNYYLPDKMPVYDDPIDNSLLAKNDGFNYMSEFTDWFCGYPDGEMAILHFTEFRYQEGGEDK